MEIGIVIIVILVAAVAAMGSSGGLGALMGNLDAEQIAGYAQNAGFTGSDLTMAVAVALAESSGNPGATGDLSITPGGSVGLWQINLHYHPEFTGWNLTDPQTNANAAFSVYTKAGGFSPWSTYSNGMASNHLADASTGVTAMQQQTNGTDIVQGA